MAKTSDHGTVGRLHIYSDVNYDRESPSVQVWCELMKDGKVIGTASGNCASETGEIEADDGRAYRRAPWAAKLMKVEGGYMAFESVNDYATAKKQR